MLRWRLPKLCAKALAHVGKSWVGSPHHGSIGLWPIPTIYFLAKYRTLYLFSSVPAEHRHRRFKVKVKNSMRGWSLQKPRVSKRGLRHVLNMETMQIGSRHYVARKGRAFLK